MTEHTMAIEGKLSEAKERHKLIKLEGEEASQKPKPNPMTLTR